MTTEHQQPWGKVPAESKFEEAVHAASGVMDDFYELYGKTAAEFYYKKYKKLPTDEKRLRLLGQLMGWAAVNRAEYDGMKMICNAEMHTNTLPVGAAMWMSRFMYGGCPKPPGTYKNPPEMELLEPAVLERFIGKHPAPCRYKSPPGNLHRDIAILIGMHTVIKLGFTPTRNDERTPPYLSAADVIAKAAGIEYFSVKKVWHDSENPKAPAYHHIPDELRKSGVALHDKEINLCQPPKGYL